MYRKSQYILLSQEHLYHDTLPFSISYTTSATFIVEVLCDTSTTVRLALSSFRDFRMMPSFRESRLEVGSSRRRLPARFLPLRGPDAGYSIQKRRLGSGDFRFLLRLLPSRFLGPHTREQFFSSGAVQNSSK